MENFIIIGVFIILIASSIIYLAKHAKGGGRGCCGGGDYKPKRKKLSKVLYTKCFKVEGMHCERCKSRVEEVVNDIKGVSGRVDLKKGELTVLYSENVDDSIIKARIKKAGYEVYNLL